MKVYKSIEIDYETMEEEDRLAREAAIEHTESEENLGFDDLDEKEAVEVETETESEIQTEEVEIVEE